MSVSSNQYYSGTTGLDGKAFADAFFAEENQVVHESDAIVLVLKKSDEINTFVDEILLQDSIPSPNSGLVREGACGHT